MSLDRTSTDHYHRRRIAPWRGTHRVAPRPQGCVRDATSTPVLEHLACLRGQPRTSRHARRRTDQPQRAGDDHRPRRRRADLHTRRRRCWRSTARPSTLNSRRPPQSGASPRSGRVRPRTSPARRRLHRRHDAHRRRTCTTLRPRADRRVRRTPAPAAALRQRVRHVRRAARLPRDRAASGASGSPTATWSSCPRSSGSSTRCPPSDVPTVPCNNDLLAANFIDDGDRIWIIDFEYAGNNDPCFELGNIWSESTCSTRPARPAGDGVLRRASWPTGWPVHAFSV